jgi:hypothetical protein
MQNVTKTNLEKAIHDNVNIAIRRYGDPKPYYYFGDTLNKNEAFACKELIREQSYSTYIVVKPHKLFKEIFTLYVRRNKMEVGNIQKHTR